MKSPGNDTIAAVATGRAGASASSASAAPTRSRCGPDLPRQGEGARSKPAPRFSSCSARPRPGFLEPIDEVLAVHMPEGRSYTGEPTVEIQGHGGRVVLEAVLQAALGAGARHAGPGRVHQARLSLRPSRPHPGRSRGRTHRRRGRGGAARRPASASRRAGGEVGRLRERLLDLVARVEAALDFEEGEIPGRLPSPGQIDGAGRRHPAAGGTRRRTAGATGESASRSPGRANSGKSSIFNYLLRF